MFDFSLPRPSLQSDSPVLFSRLSALFPFSPLFPTSTTRPRNTEGSLRSGSPCFEELILAFTRMSNSNLNRSEDDALSESTQLLAHRHIGIGSSIPETAAESPATSTSFLWPRFLLLVVAFLYGTLNVTLRWMYGMDGPPSASALSTSRGWLAVACFGPFLCCRRRQNSAAAKATTPQVRSMWLVALELGFWNFAAQGLINAGLRYTTAARAAFLTQCSVVITPMISVCFGTAPRKTVWIASILAVCGLSVLSLSNTSSSNDGKVQPWLDLGDFLVFGGALCWSCYIFRLSATGDSYDEINLQSLKSVFLATFYTVWFLTARFATASQLWPGWKNLTGWLILFYSALGPGSVADILQQKAQAVVSAAESNVLISLEPVFTSMLARILLGELTTWMEKFGGLLIISAAVLASC